MTLLLLSLLIFIISFLGMYYGTYYIFGRRDFIKGHDLSEEEYMCIKDCGLIHYTNIVNLNKILESNCLLPSNHIKSYSNAFIPSVFFIAASYHDKEKVDFNINNKKCYIKVSNLNDEQLSNLKIRKFDKTIIHTGKFVIDDNNIIDTWQDTTAEIEESKLQDIINILKNIPNANGKYSKELMLSSIWPFIITFSLVSLAFYFINRYLNF